MIKKIVSIIKLINDVGVENAFISNLFVDIILLVLLFWLILSPKLKI